MKKCNMCKIRKESIDHRHRYRKRILHYCHNMRTRLAAECPRNAMRQQQHELDFNSLAYHFVWFVLHNFIQFVTVNGEWSEVQLHLTHSTNFQLTPKERWDEKYDTTRLASICDFAKAKRTSQQCFSDFL